MKVYVASAATNWFKVNKVQRSLRMLGCTITCDWTRRIGESGVDNNSKAADEDLAGVTCADVVVVLLPGRIGTYIEIGYALAKEIPILVVGENERPSTFFHLPEFTHFKRVEDLLSHVKEQICQTSKR